MQIIKKKISQLKPSPYNPRKDLTSDDPEYQKLKKSILEFDYIDPIIWNQKTNRVVGGNQRLKILKELGKEEVEVSVVDLEDDKEKALCIALNKISGEFDFPKLKDLLVEIDTGNIDMEITGFDESELKKMFDFEGYSDSNFENKQKNQKLVTCPKCGAEFEA